MTAAASNSICLLLTATINVNEDVVFTERREAKARIDDYKKALRLWLAHPQVQSLVLVENSGADLSPLQYIADQAHGKRVELLSFTAPAFDGSLGKGVGEMICLEHACAHSQLLKHASHFIKVTGRYYLANASDLLHLAVSRRDAAVICDMLLNLTWADSRAFAATPHFLRTYLIPLKDQINDSLGSNFEHVLARAVHACMADRGLWVEPPFPLHVQGISGSQNRRWKMSLWEKQKLRLRHKLLARTLTTGPR